METRNGLEELINSFRFNKEPTLLYILPGIFLIISLPTMTVLVFHSLFYGVEESLLLWYRSLAALYLGYVLAASYTGYRLYSVVRKHLVDSGITSYYWLKKKGDVESVKKLYLGGLMRKTLAAPATVFTIVLLSGGLAYPIFLYMAEERLREHAYGEEKKFLGRLITKRIGVENALIDLAATLLTLGGYLSFWGYRIAYIYNRHIDLVHGKHPESPTPLNIEENKETLTTSGDKEPEGTKGIGLAILGLVFLGIGVYGFLGYMGLPCYFPALLGYGSLIATVALLYRTKKSSIQVLYTYLIVYCVFISFTLIGFLGANAYLGLYNEMKQGMKQIVSRDLFTITRNIFINNMAISAISLVPVIGPFYIGVGLGNAGLFYGVLLHDSFMQGNFSPIILLVLPHSIIELLAYSIFVSASTRIIIDKTRRAVEKIFLGIIVLLLAAIIEGLTIISAK